MSVRTTVKSIQDIMRQDTGVDGDAQRISQLCWMFFLKIIDDQDQELELLSAEYRSPLPKKYQDEGVTDLDNPRILQIAPFDTMGTPLQLIKQFGGRSEFERAVHELQSALYEGAA